MDGKIRLRQVSGNLPRSCRASGRFRVVVGDDHFQFLPRTQDRERRHLIFCSHLWEYIGLVSDIDVPDWLFSVFEGLLTDDRIPRQVRGKFVL